MFDKGYPSGDSEVLADGVSDGALSIRLRWDAAELRTELAAIAAAEREINQLQAEQVRRVADFARRRREWDAATTPGFDNTAERVLAAEVAAARGVSVTSACYFINDSERLRRMPRLMAVFSAGDISVFSARTAAAEAQVSEKWSAVVDEMVAAEIAQVLPGQVRAMVRSRVAALDPEALNHRSRAARKGRHVTAAPADEPGMGLLTAIVPMEQAEACWYALDSYSRGARADGDPRAVSQIMADTLVERVTGQRHAEQVTAHVNLVMTDTSLLGSDDIPAQLSHLGPIPGALARELATSSRAWLRRLFTDPADGTVATVDTGRRRFDGALRQLILARDQRCRGVGCDAVIVDIDHIDDYHAGGATSADNGDGLCQRCHHAKDHPGITVRAGGLGVTGDTTTAGAALLRWTSPIGVTLPTLARPALGYGTASRAQLRHRGGHAHRIDITHPPWIWSVNGTKVIPRTPLEIRVVQLLHSA